MTHDELLDRIAQEGLKPYGNVMNTNLVLALRAVVELHKPRPEPKNSPFKDSCNGCSKTYPCKTIQAIEKELSNG
jgi:hypothetical protein